jgi:ArsR family transcriptional regulator
MKNIVCFHSALASEYRLRILNLINRTELSVQKIEEVLKPCRQSKISRHLAYLRKAKLVKFRRNGKWVYYSAEKLQKNLKTGLSSSLEYIRQKPEVKKDEERLKKASVSS